LFGQSFKRLGRLVQRWAESRKKAPDAERLRTLIRRARIKHLINVEG
jgi:hypothetical protein